MVTAVASPSHCLLNVADLSVGLRQAGKTISLLDKISFKLKAGESMALIGESGSGKTLTALALLGVLPRHIRCTGGEVWFGGQQVLGKSTSALENLRGREIAMIFQEPGAALNPVFRVGGQIADIIKAHLHASSCAAQEQTLHELRQVGFEEPRAVYDAYPHQLSGGMAQRVMIAMALSCSPKLMIADEPTTALDVSTQNEILNLIFNLQQQRGFALLLISHDLGVVRSLADSVVVLQSGRVVESGEVERVMAAPQHVHTQKLVESVAELMLPLPVDDDG